ncbi:prepilin peptidase [Lactonifactor longoviformis]|uniref:Prepilin leader peptidase/N-methyltransferase n=2 Tax=Lactonifactor TaxID=420345 RepID=A0A1M4SZI5_9CLOT|nr:A24 family peptidase [Lactonifactor longoviformis]SHE37611.1 type 4 prepilin peptidase 1 . Aspartic peptidase. MEROPS family A24A [Lactonifactor longoviformis DSM 17459]
MLYFLEILLFVLIFLFGASFFSFLNVVIYRLPKKISFVGGRSFCPICGETLKGRDMIPIFSYLLLRGRCRNCGAPISSRYPLVEALGGCFSVLCLRQFGNTGEGFYQITLSAVTVFAFLSILTTVTFIDLDTMEIPNGLVLAAAGCGLVSVFVFPDITLLSRIIGVFSVSVPLLLITLLIPGAFGGGDIKLMAACGLFLGWQLSLVSLFLAVLSGGLYGGGLLAAEKKGRKEHFAFGPFLCAGMGIAFFCGNEILNWYLGFFRF